VLGAKHPVYISFSFLSKDVSRGHSVNGLWQLVGSLLAVAVCWQFVEPLRAVRGQFIGFREKFVVISWAFCWQFVKTL
jgi:hypothetical protein